MAIRFAMRLILIAAMASSSLAIALDRVASSTAVKGEVTLVTTELCVVKDGNGKGVMMQIDERTTLEGTLRTGVQVEALVTPDGRAVSIKTVRK
jgi:hypothetical protein